MNPGPQSILSKASVPQALRNALITTPLLLLFAFGFAAMKYLDEVNPERSLSTELTITLVSILPWFFVSPIVVLIAFHQSFQKARWERIILEILFLAVAIVGILIAHITLIEAPFWGRTVGQILTGSTIGGQMWDILIFCIALLSGHVQGAVHHNRLATDSGVGGQKILARSASRVDIVDIDDVIAASAQGNYVALITAKAKFLHRATLAEINKQLAPHGFVQIHRSHLVRTTAIAAVVRADGKIREIQTHNGELFPVSAAKQDIVSSMLNATELAA